MTEREYTRLHWGKEYYNNKLPMHADLVEGLFRVKDSLQILKTRFWHMCVLAFLLNLELFIIISCIYLHLI